MVERHDALGNERSIRIWLDLSNGQRAAITVLGENGRQPSAPPLYA